jgi:hypothetical protein
MTSKLQEPRRVTERRVNRRREPLLVAITVVLASIVTAGIVLVQLGSGDRRPTVAGPTPNGPALPSSRVTPADPTRALPVPATGAYFGIYNNPRGQDRQAALAALESKVGRRFDIDHVYYKWDAPFPTSYERSSSAAGRAPLINWVSTRRDGSQVKWRDIANGQQDGVIIAHAEALRAFAKPVLLVFQHEPGKLVGEGPGKHGTAEDYRAAWRHLASVIRARGASNVSFVWVLTAFNFRAAAKGTGQNSPDSLYPGDDVIDWIGVDGYNYYNCAAFGKTPWRSFDEVFGAWYEWAKPHGKPLMIAEWGVQEDPARPNRKGEWFREVAQAVQSKPEIKALVYFNSAPACPNWVDSSPSAFDGFQSLARDRYFLPES